MANISEPSPQESLVAFNAQEYAMDIYIGEDVIRQVSNEKLIDEWRLLYETCPWATIYQSIDFISNWYRVYQREHTPILVMAVGNDRLMGVLALCLNGAKKISGAGLHQAEYQTWISSDSDGNRFIKEALMMVRKRWPGHRIQLKYLPQNTPLDWTDTTLFGRKFSWIQSVKHPIMNIDREWLETELRKKNRREKINRLNKVGHLRLERIIDFADFEASFKALLTLNDFRKGAVYNATNFQRQDLFQEFLLSLFKVGLLHVTVLKVGNEIIAANVGTMGKKWVHLQGMNAHSPAFARHSPGILHFLMMGQMLANEGFEVFDLTPGSDEYKNTLATDFIEAHQLNVADPASLLLQKNASKLRHQLRSLLSKFGVDVRTQRKAKKRAEVLSDKLKIMGNGGISSLLHLIHSKLGNKNRAQSYIIDVNGDTVKPLNFILNKYSLQDLLKFESRGTLLTRWEFLEDAMNRLEIGQQPYSVADETRLLLLVWEEKADSKAVSGKSSSSGGGAVRLSNLYYHPQGKGLVKEFLEEVAKKCLPENTPGPSPVYIKVNSNAAAAIIQKSGFAQV